MSAKQAIVFSRGRKKKRKNTNTQSRDLKMPFGTANDPYSV